MWSATVKFKYAAYDKIVLLNMNSFMLLNSKYWISYLKSKSSLSHLNPAAAHMANLCFAESKCSMRLPSLFSVLLDGLCVCFRMFAIVSSQQRRFG